MKEFTCINENYCKYLLKKIDGVHKRIVRYTQLNALTGR